MSEGPHEARRDFCMINQAETEAGMMVVAALTGAGAAAVASVAGAGADSPLTSF